MGEQRGPGGVATVITARAQQGAGDSALQPTELQVLCWATSIPALADQAPGGVQIPRASEGKGPVCWGCSE